MPPRLWIPKSPNEAKHFTNRATRAEALSLYREILRTCKHFHWADENDVPWNKRLKQQAREEFEQARNEKDPLIVARLLVTGRDCVQQIQNKFQAATNAAWQRIEKDSERRP